MKKLQYKKGIIQFPDSWIILPQRDPMRFEIPIYVRFNKADSYHLPTFVTFVNDTELNAPVLDKLVLGLIFDYEPDIKDLFEQCMGPYMHRFEPDGIGLPDSMWDVLPVPSFNVFMYVDNPDRHPSAFIRKTYVS